VNFSFLVERSLLHRSPRPRDVMLIKQDSGFGRPIPIGSTRVSLEGEPTSLDVRGGDQPARGTL
jgi:hypothetical protein